MKYLFPALLFFFLVVQAAAQNKSLKQMSPIPEDTLHIDFYMGIGCPHCAQIKPFMEEVKAKYPQVKFREYEIYGNRDNLLELNKRFRKLDIPFKYQCVPALFIEAECLTGYKDIRFKLEEAIEKRLKKENPK